MLRARGMYIDIALFTITFTSSLFCFFELFVIWYSTTVTSRALKEIQNELCGWLDIANNQNESNNTSLYEHSMQVPGKEVTNISPLKRLIITRDHFRYVYRGRKMHGKQLLNPVMLLVTLLQGITAKAGPKEDVFGPGGISHSSSFNEAVLGAHNDYRQMHHSQHIYLDPKLTEEAQNYAKELSIRGISLLRHSQGYQEKGYGENIYAICDRHVLSIDPVKNWYSKVCHYDFLTHAAKSKTKPVKEFTQVVWRGTEKLGVGRATSYLDKPCTYIVVRYLPRHDPAVRRTNVDVGDFNKEICKDSSYVGFGARG